MWLLSVVNNSFLDLGHFCQQNCPTNQGALFVWGKSSEEQKATDPWAWKTGNYFKSIRLI